MRIKGVILDVDGTLVDSNDAHTRAWLEALAQHGYNCRYDEVRRLIGMGADNMLPTLVKVEADTPEGKSLSDAWREIFERDYLPRLQPFPRTKEMLEGLKQRGFKLVVASSAEKEMLEQLLEIAGATDLIEGSTSSDDAENSKPDPDIVKAALDQLGLQPGEVLMVGDTPYDVEAAAKLDIGTIGLRCGGWDDEGLKDAVAVYDDPAGLLAHLDDSPLVRS